MVSSMHVELSNTAKQLREHKTVLEELMVENVQLEEELKVKQEGSMEEGWWEVDARQLLKVGEKLTLEVGNLLERTGDGGEEQVTGIVCYIQTALVGNATHSMHTAKVSSRLPAMTFQNTHNLLWD